MCIKNTEASGIPQDGFLFMGKAYRPSGHPLGRPTLVTLNYNLEPEMKLHLLDREMVADDEQMIRQVLFLLMEDAHSLQDVRDSLPEELISLLPTDVQRLSRLRPAGYSLKQERHKKEFKKISDKMAFYSVTGLLY